MFKNLSNPNQLYSKHILLLGLVRNAEALSFTNIAVTYPITRLKFNGFQKLISSSSEFLSKITHFIINVFGLLKRSKQKKYFNQLFLK